MSIRARIAPLVSLLVLASACAGGRGAREAVQVAFVGDLSMEGTFELVTPSLNGARLRLERAEAAGEVPAGIEIVERDTHGDPAEAIRIAAEIAADPKVVAVIAAPFWDEPEKASERLAGAGVPVIAFTGGYPAGEGVRLSTVTGTERIAGELAGYAEESAGEDGICLAGDGSPYARDLVWAVEGALDVPPRLTERAPVTDAEAASSLAGRVAEAGCGIVVWGGYAEAGARLRVALSERGLDSVAMVGADALKDPTYLYAAGRAGDGTVVLCSCADVSMGTNPAVRAFVHDYQAAYGSAPGTYAAEGWDAAGMLTGAIGEGIPSREAVGVFLGGLEDYRGLARTYAFENGRPSGPDAAPRVLENVYGRWVPMEGAGGGFLPESVEPVK